VYIGFALKNEGQPISLSASPLANGLDSEGLSRLFIMIDANFTANNQPGPL